MTITKELLKSMVIQGIPFQDGDTLDKEATYELIFHPLDVKSTRNSFVCEKLYGKREIDILFRNSSDFCKQEKRWFTINVTYCCSYCGNDLLVEMSKTNILKFDCYRHIKTSNAYFGKNFYYGNYHSLAMEYLGHDKKKPICQDCYDKNVSIVREEVRKIGLNPLQYLNGSIETFINLENGKLFQNVKREYDTGKILEYVCNITGETYVEPEYQEVINREEEVRRKDLERKRKKEEEIAAKNASISKCDDINEETNIYIKKFCTPNANIDIKDGKLQDSVLHPSDKVDLNVVKTHNCCILKYKEYLQTPLWKIVAYKVKKRDGFKCRKCGSNVNVDVHHTSYEHLGIDFKAMHRLETLCRECHGNKHENANVEPACKMLANDSDLLYDIRGRLDEEISIREQQGDILGGTKLREIKKEVMILIDRYL